MIIKTTIIALGVILLILPQATGGEPAWDPDFHSADLFVLVPLARLDPRYLRHFLGAGCALAQVA